MKTLIENQDAEIRKFLARQFDQKGYKTVQERKEFIANLLKNQQVFNIIYDALPSKLSAITPVQLKGIVKMMSLEPEENHPFSLNEAEKNMLKVINKEGKKFYKDIKTRLTDAKTGKIDNEKVALLKEEWVLKSCANLLREDYPTKDIRIIEVLEALNAVVNHNLQDDKATLLQQELKELLMLDEKRDLEKKQEKAPNQDEAIRKFLDEDFFFDTSKEDIIEALKQKDALKNIFTTTKENFPDTDIKDEKLSSILEKMLSELEENNENPNQDAKILRFVKKDFFFDTSKEDMKKTLEEKDKDKLEYLFQAVKSVSPEITLDKTYEIIKFILLEPEENGVIFETKTEINKLKNFNPVFKKLYNDLKLRVTDAKTGELSQKKMKVMSEAGVMKIFTNLNKNVKLYVKDDKSLETEDVEEFLCTIERLHLEEKGHLWVKNKFTDLKKLIDDHRKMTFGLDYLKLKDEIVRDYRPIHIDLDDPQQMEEAFAMEEAFQKIMLEEDMFNKADQQM